VDNSGKTEGCGQGLRAGEEKEVHILIIASKLPVMQ